MISASRAHGGVLPYHLTDLGTLGGDQSAAYAISSAGQVVGDSSLTGNSGLHAFSKFAGGLSDLGVLDGYTNSTATAVNSSGQIVGYSFTATPQLSLNRAYYYSNGMMVDLGTLGGSGSQAFGINGAGNVVGQSDDAGGNRHAFFYSSETMKDLGTLGGSESLAYGINSNSVIVGSANLAGDSNYHAFSYRQGVMSDLGALEDGTSVAYAINDAEMIVGYSMANQQRHATLFNAGSVLDLDPTGHSGSEAYGINSAGQIVGYAGNKAFLYTNGAMYDLNSVLDGSSDGWWLLAALGINDSGCIVGYGTSPQGDSHAFLLTPVPEPPALLTMMIFVAIASIRIHRRRVVAHQP